jgi:hypothetical protein
MRTIGKFWLALVLLAFTPIVSVALHQGSAPAPAVSVSNVTVVQKNKIEPTVQQLAAKALEMAREQNRATAGNDEGTPQQAIRSQWI